MDWQRCVPVPVADHGPELHAKQRVQTHFVAMSGDHVTEEDVEIFAQVQELAAQVRSHDNATRSESFIFVITAYKNIVFLFLYVSFFLS